MHIKSFAIVLLSGLVCVGAVTDADAAIVRGVAIPPHIQITPFEAWLAANGRMAIELQAGDNMDHHHGGGVTGEGLAAHGADARGGQHGGRH